MIQAVIKLARVGRNEMERSESIINIISYSEMLHLYQPGLRQICDLYHILRLNIYYSGDYYYIANSDSGKELLLIFRACTGLQSKIGVIIHTIVDLHNNLQIQYSLLKKNSANISNFITISKKSIKWKYVLNY